jgi:hypothetical protein
MTQLQKFSASTAPFLHFIQSAHWIQTVSVDSLKFFTFRNSFYSMSKNYLIWFLILSTTSCLMLSCKKYPEGGRLKKAEKNIRGGINDGHEKQWKVTLYEVDGVDSTKTWKKGKSQDRFSYYDVQISGSESYLHIVTEVTELRGALVNKNKTLRITPDDSLKSWHCYRTNICERNIFMPFETSSCEWQIQQLEENDIKITLNDLHSYTVKMEYADAE